MIWVYFLFKIVLSAAIIGVGVGLVRNVHSQAGLMLAGAGGVELLTVCCFRVMGVAMSPGNGLWTVASTVLGAAAHILFVGLLVAALIVLAKELIRRKEAGAAPPPTIF